MAQETVFFSSLSFVLIRVKIIIAYIIMLWRANEIVEIFLMAA
jgi:hypothetical protein